MGKLPSRRHNHVFVSYRRDELNGLLPHGTLKFVKAGDVPDGTRVFRSRFIDEVKQAGNMLRCNSMIVAKNDSDEDAGKIGTKAVTIQGSHREYYCVWTFRCQGMSYFRGM